MIRKHLNEKEYFQCYHTQEYRSQALTSPIKCIDTKAWLGPGYYFWIEEIFAVHWGKDFKTKTNGYFDVYTVLIEDKNLLNTTFCEDDYFFFKNNVNKLINRIKSDNIDVNLKEVHRLLSKEFWEPMGILGIIYDDLPHNNYKKDRTYSLIEPLYYIKRIQIVVFNDILIENFEEYLIEQE